MPTKKQLKYYWHIVLPSIANDLFSNCDRSIVKKLHVAYKKYFDIDSVSKLNKKEMSLYLTELCAFASSEFGCEIPSSDDPSNFKNMTLEDVWCRSRAQDD
jgi:hypothetical protein